MTDYGDFKVQSDALRAESKTWGDKATDASSALKLISEAVDQGNAFGYLAGSCGVKDAYNSWSEAMSQALSDAERCFDYIEQALLSAANAYDGSDATAATSIDQLNNMADLDSAPPAGTTPQGPTPQGPTQQGPTQQGPTPTPGSPTTPGQPDQPGSTGTQGVSV